MFGEVLDAFHQGYRHVADDEPEAWKVGAKLVEAVERRWTEPDGNEVKGTVTLTGPGNAPLRPSIEVQVDVTCGALADPAPFH